MSKRIKVLFFAEDVTLAHVGRMVVLASALDRQRYEAVIACGVKYRHFAQAAGLRVVPIESMAGDEFNRRLNAGSPVYPSQWLRKLVADDLKVLAAETPALVVGDFRCSLGISAELAGVPHFAVINGAWSPRSTLRFPLPDGPFERLFGVALGGFLFRQVLPLASAYNMRDFNRYRREVGLREVESLQEMYTLGTKTLYTDIPAMAPVSSLPAGHQYLGPVQWEPPLALPEWWGQVPTNQPIVYAGMGSSGDANVMPELGKALRELKVTSLLATADQPIDPTTTPYASSYLPGMACAARADVVICNGGSGAVYQALSQGKPVLCIPSNADQYLVTEALVAQGAARMIRAGRATANAIVREVKHLLETPEPRARASELAKQVALHHGPARFVSLLETWLSTTQAPRAIDETEQSHAA